MTPCKLCIISRFGVEDHYATHDIYKISCKFSFIPLTKAAIVSRISVILKLIDIAIVHRTRIMMPKRATPTVMRVPMLLSLKQRLRKAAANAAILIKRCQGIPWNDQTQAKVTYDHMRRV